PDPIGWQMDKRGGIWDYWHIPTFERHDMGSSEELKLVLRNEPIRISEQECVFRAYAQTVRVNKFTRRIESAFQQEELQTCHPVPGGFRQASYVRWFDASGRPGGSLSGMFTENIWANCYIIKPYAPVNFYRGKDMRTSFKTYLMSHGMADLVPDDLQGKTQ